VEDELVQLEQRIVDVELRVTELLRSIEERHSGGRATQPLEVRLRTAQALRDVLYNCRALLLTRQRDKPGTL
jgi:hypothetical protein